MNAQYVDERGVGFNIHKDSDGTWSVWEFRTVEAGWLWVAKFRSYSLAMSFMCWFGSFKNGGAE